MTGSSVIGVKFKDGVLLACDTLGEFMCHGGAFVASIL